MSNSRAYTRLLKQVDEPAWFERGGTAILREITQRLLILGVIIGANFLMLGILVWIATSPERILLIVLTLLAYLGLTTARRWRREKRSNPNMVAADKVTHSSVTVITAGNHINVAPSPARANRARPRMKRLVVPHRIVKYPDRPLPEVADKLQHVVASEQEQAARQVELFRRVTYRSLLRNNNFRLVWLSGIISTFGNTFTRLAIPVYVFSLTNSYWQLGLAVFWGLAASLVFDLMSGMLMDRWNRRTTMVGVSIVNGVLLLVLVGVVFWNPALPIQLAAVYALNFVTTLLRYLFAAMRVAIFPEVLAEDEYLVADTLDQSTTQFAELLSYPLLILVLVLGPALAFGLEAASFLAAALLLSRVRTQPVPMEQEGNPALLHAIAASLRTTWRLPLVPSIVLLSFIVPVVFSLMFTLQIPYVVDVAGSTEEVGFPLLEGAIALGFVIGTVLLRPLVERWSSVLAVGIVGMGGALVLQGLLPYLVGQNRATFVIHPTLTTLLLTAVPVLLFIGMTNSLVVISIRTAVHEYTPHAVMRRVFSVLGVVASVGFAVGALLTQAAQGRVPQTLMVMGAVLVFAGLACSAALRDTKRHALSRSQVTELK